MRTEIKQALFMCKNYARIQCRCFVCHNAVLASPSAIFFYHFLPVFSFLYSLLRKLYYRIFIMVLYNLGKCSFLHNKLSSNFSPNLPRSQSGLKFVNRLSLIGVTLKGIPCAYQNIYITLKNETITAFFETPKNTKQVERGRRTVYSITC